LAAALIAAPAAEAGDGLPPAAALPPLSEVVLIGDFLSPEAEIATTLRGISGRGARGHLLLVSDPIEDVFPFSGRTELIEPEAGLRFTAGRAQDLKHAYLDRLAAHREAVRRAAVSLGWSLALHRTDRTAAEALLALSMRLGEPPLTTAAWGVAV